MHVTAARPGSVPAGPARVGGECLCLLACRVHDVIPPHRVVCLSRLPHVIVQGLASVSHSPGSTCSCLPCTARDRMPPQPLCAHVLPAMALASARAGWESTTRANACWVRPSQRGAGVQSASRACQPWTAKHVVTPENASGHPDCRPLRQRHGYQCPQPGKRGRRSHVPQRWHGPVGRCLVSAHFMGCPAAPFICCPPARAATQQRPSTCGRVPSVRTACRFICLSLLRFLSCRVRRCVLLHSTATILPVRDAAGNRVLSGGDYL